MISVIVPVYNSAEYLSDCLNSILNQTYSDFEVIVVDDGSTDMSMDIIEDYCSRDDRIKSFRKTNGGVSDARNFGLVNSSGEYVSFVDSDDELSPFFLERMLTLLKQEDADVAVCSICRDKVKINLPDETVSIKQEIISSMEALERLCEIRFITVWNRLYKREIFKNIQFPVGKLNEDVFIAHKVFLNAKKVAVLNQNLYFYREIGSSIMHQGGNIRLLDGVEGCFLRFRDYERLQFTNLLYDTALCGRNCFEYWNWRFQRNSELRKRKREILRMLRYMFFHVPHRLSVKNYIVALAPNMYFFSKEALRFLSK